LCICCKEICANVLLCMVRCFLQDEEEEGGGRQDEECGVVLLSVAGEQNATPCSQVCELVKAIKPVIPDDH